MDHGQQSLQLSNSEQARHAHRADDLEQLVPAGVAAGSLCSQKLYMTRNTQSGPTTTKSSRNQVFAYFTQMLLKFITVRPLECIP